MTKILILNGPPRCGKDIAAEAVQNYFTVDYCAHMKFSQPLKTIACGIFGKSQQTLEWTSKDTPVKGYSVSFREAQIHTYTALAQIFGADWLGKSLIHRLENIEQEYIVLSDGGRAADILPLLKKFSVDDIMIVQIMREGCTFAGDIRSYISAGMNVRVRPIINNKIDVFTEEIIDFAGEFFAK